MRVGEYTCNSQTTSEGSESTLLLVFFTARLCHRLTTAETNVVITA